jgi:uncharacterized protein
MVMSERVRLEKLSRDQCMQLLSSHPVPIGRIALADPRPLIFPVNYHVYEGSIVFRTDHGTKLDRAIRGEFVAFEVDEVVPNFHIGWSVLVRGQAKEVTDEEELKALKSLPLRSWAPGEKGHYVRVDPQTVAGRRIT